MSPVAADLASAESAPAEVDDPPPEDDPPEDELVALGVVAWPVDWLLDEPPEDPHPGATTAAIARHASHSLWNRSMNSECGDDLTIS